MSTYSCPVCGHGPTAYLTCNHPACPDGRDPGHPDADWNGFPQRAADGNTYRYHVTGLPAGGDAMPIDLDRMTNDPGYEHYAYRRKQSPRYPTKGELDRRLRHRRMWQLGVLLLAAYGAYCLLVHG